MSNLPKLIAGGAQCLIVAAGCALLWRHVARPQARAQRRESPLAAWNIPPPDLLFFLFYVFGGAFIGSTIAALTAGSLGLSGDRLIVFSTATSHLGILAGVGWFSRSDRGYLVRSSTSSANIFTSGLATFLIAMPFVYAAGILWGGLLQLVGLPVKQQLAVELFARLKAGPWLAVMMVTAIVIAPTTEELVFRAGLFRYVRTRLPRWAALLLPACLFAAMHFDLTSYAQLAFLGIVFSVAYERTGRIGTTIVAHAAFNLNMLLLLLAGVT